MTIRPSIPLRTEHRMLLGCLHHPSLRAQYHDLWTESCNIDWDYLIALATRHDLLPFLHFFALEIAREIPHEAKRTLHDHFHASDLRNKLALSLFHEWHRYFSDYELKPILFKGLLYSTLIYEHPALRQFGDIDILIPPDRVEEVHAAFLEKGYRPVYPSSMLRDKRVQTLSAAQDRVYFENYQELTLESPDTLFQLDIHWGLSPRIYSSSLELSALFREARTVNLKGTRVATPSPEHQLIHTCVHAVKHRWQLLKWVVDIDRLIRHHSGIDWDRVFAYARKTDTHRMCDLGLCLSHTLLHTDLPAPAQKAVNQPWLSKHVSSIVQRFLLLEEKHNRISRCLGLNGLYLRLCGTAYTKSRYLYRALTLPRPEDEVLLSSFRPDSQPWRWTRPLRVLVKCAKRLG